MKTYWYYFTVAGLFLAPFCPASVSPNNLVTNGDFENGSTKWREDKNVVFETPEKTNQVCEIRVDKAKTIRFSQRINIAHLKKVTIKFRIKKSADYVSKERVGWSVGLGSHGTGKGIPRKGWNEMDITASNLDDDDWVDLVFRVGPGQSGSISFDDIEVYEYVEPSSNDAQSPLASDANADADEYFDLTAKDGRTINAKIIRTLNDNQQVVVQRKGEIQIITAPVNVFDDVTQSYIKWWATASKILSDQYLTLKTEASKKVVSDKSRTGYSRTTTGSAVDNSSERIYHANWMDMTIQNKSDDAFSNIIFEYTIYYHQGVLHGTQYRQQTLDIPPRSERSIKTDEIVLGTFDSPQMGKPSEGELDGIIIHLEMKSDTGPSIRREFVYPESLSYSWTTKNTRVHVGGVD